MRGPDVKKARDLSDAPEHLEPPGAHGLVNGAQRAVEVYVLEALEAHVPDVDVALDLRAAPEALDVARVHDPVAFAGLGTLTLLARDALAVFDLLVHRAGRDAAGIVDQGALGTLAYAFQAVNVLAARLPRAGFRVVAGTKVKKSLVINYCNVRNVFDRFYNDPHNFSLFPSEFEGSRKIKKINLRTTFPTRSTVLFSRGCFSAHL